MYYEESMVFILREKRNPPNKSGDLLLNVKSDYGNYLRFDAALRFGAAFLAGRFTAFLAGRFTAFLAGRFTAFFLAAILYYFTLLSRFMSPRN
jgi:hypothetical protein